MEQMTFLITVDYFILTKYNMLDYSDKYWIQDAMKHIKKGALTSQAARVGKKPLQYAKAVLAEPKKHTETTRKRAQFLINIQGKK
jgi:hypothetical protein